MGGELLIFLAWLAGWLKTIFLFMITTGTNEGLIAFFLKNILLLYLVTKITPGDWDNRLLTWMQEKISNFKNKGEDKDVKEIK